MQEPGEEPSAQAARDRYRTHRRLYYLTGFLNIFGNGTLLLAGTVFVYQTTQNLTDVALIMVAVNMPSVFLIGPATWLATHWGGAKLFVGRQVGGFLLCIAGAVLHAGGWMTVPVLLCWFLALGIVTGLTSVALPLVAQILAPEGQLQEVNSNAASIISGATATGAILGAVIYDLAGLEWVFVADAMSCIPLGMVFFSLKKQHTHVPPTEPARLRRSITILTSEPGLRAIFVFTAICYFIGGYTVTLPAIAGSIHSSATTLAWMHAASIGGAALVGLGVRHLHLRVSWGRVQQAALVVFTVGVLAICLMRIVWVESTELHPMLATVIVLLAVFPIGFALGLDATVLNGLLQTNAPASARAALLSAYTVIPLAMLPIGQGVIGTFADVFGVAPALGAIGLISLLYVCISPRTALRHTFDALEDSGVVPEVAQHHNQTMFTTNRNSHRDWLNAHRSINEDI